MTILSFDVGAKRIGVAISRSGIIAEPFTTIDATAEDAEDQVRRIVQSEHATTLVVGLPDRVGRRSDLVDDFIDQLSLIITPDVEIVTVDETLTTKEAERLSRPGTDTDALAAALILEQFLAERGAA